MEVQQVLDIVDLPADDGEGASHLKLCSSSSIIVHRMSHVLCTPYHFTPLVNC